MKKRTLNNFIAAPAVMIIFFSSPAIASVGFDLGGRELLNERKT